MQRYILLALTFGWMAVLLGYMEAQHEFERVAPSTTLVTNHFSGEVRLCRVYRSGDMSCGPADVEPRSWVFALIPFWPARSDLAGKLHLPQAADQMPFTQTQFFSDLVVNGPLAIVMLVVGILIMRIRDDEGSDNADGGSDGGGAGGTGGE